MFVLASFIDSDDTIEGPYYVTKPFQPNPTGARRA